MAVLLELMVIPGARMFRVTAYGDRMLKIAVTARPERGRANRELCERIARILEIPGDLVLLIGGSGSRHKLIKIETTLSQEDIREILLAHNSKG